MEAKNNRRLLSLPFKWYLHDFTSVDSDCSLHSLWFGNPAKDGRKVKSNWKIVSMSVGYKFRSLKSNQNSAFPWFFLCFGRLLANWRDSAVIPRTIPGVTEGHRTWRPRCPRFVTLLDESTVTTRSQKNSWSHRLIHRPASQLIPIEHQPTTLW